MLKIPLKHNYRIELADILGQEHWYRVWEIIKQKEKYLGVFPSSSTILQAYPFSPHLVKWIGEKGNEEANRIKYDAAFEGRRVHENIEALLAGTMLEKTEFSIKEWNNLFAFTQWFGAFQPEVLGTEVPLFSKRYKYAGRTDIIAKIQGKIGIGDYKTSGSIYNSFNLQTASYAEAFEKMSGLRVDFTFILQLGAKNKLNYRYVVADDWHNHVPTFLSVFNTWRYDNNIDESFNPPILNLPATLKL